MDEKQEQVYIQGSRAAWAAMLQVCLKHLGYDAPESQRVSWILEREAAIVQLRDVCESFGDNDWDERLSLADVIEKHLGRHLHAKETP